MIEASDAARGYSRANGDRFLHELFAMLRIPSLSGDPAHAGDIRRMADWLAGHMQALGLEKVAVMETAATPSSTASGWARVQTSRPCSSTATTMSCRR